MRADVRAGWPSPTSHLHSMTREATLGNKGRNDKTPADIASEGPERRKPQTGSSGAFMKLRLLDSNQRQGG